MKNNKSVIEGLILRKNVGWPKELLGNSTDYCFAMRRAISFAGIFRNYYPYYGYCKKTKSFKDVGERNYSLFGDVVIDEIKTMFITHRDENLLKLLEMEDVKRFVTRDIIGTKVRYKRNVKSIK